MNQSLPDRPLNDLAAQIKAEHATLLASARQTLAHAIAVGELLAEAKKQLPHGRFMPWVTANCDFTTRTASNFLRLHREQGRLETASSNRQSISDLGVVDAIKLLSAPKPWAPKAGRDYVGFVLRDDGPGTYVRVASAGNGGFWFAVTHMRADVVFGDHLPVRGEAVALMLAGHNVDADAVEWQERPSDPAHAGRTYSPLMFSSDDEARRWLRNPDTHNRDGDPMRHNASPEERALLDREFRAGDALLRSKIDAAGGIGVIAAPQREKGGRK